MMNLSRFLNPHYIVIGLPVMSKEQAILHLVKSIASDHPGLDTMALYSKILDREYAVDSGLISIFSFCMNIGAIS